MRELKWFITGNELSYSGLTGGLTSASVSLINLCLDFLAVSVPQRSHPSSPATLSPVGVAKMESGNQSSRITRLSISSEFLSALACYGRQSNELARHTEKVTAPSFKAPL